MGPVLLFFLVFATFGVLALLDLRDTVQATSKPAAVASAIHCVMAGSVAALWLSLFKAAWFAYAKTL